MSNLLAPTGPAVAARSGGPHLPDDRPSTAGAVSSFLGAEIERSTRLSMPDAVALAIEQA